MRTPAFCLNVADSWKSHLSTTAARVKLKLILRGLRLICLSKLSKRFRWKTVFLEKKKKKNPADLSHTCQIGAPLLMFSWGGTGHLLMQRSAVKSLKLHVDVSFGRSLTLKLLPVGLLLLFFFLISQYEAWWFLLLLADWKSDGTLA